MKNLIILFFILTSINLQLFANETGKSKVIFKLREKVFTNIDFERRIKYLEIINNFNSTELKDSQITEIYNDYISALIFNEYYILNNINFKISEKEINLLYETKIQNYSINNKINKDEITYLKYNIYTDLVRKKIIENSLNSQKTILLEETNTKDLLYDYNFSYLIFREDSIDKFSIKNLNNRIEFIELKNQLTTNNIDFLYKNETINNNEILSNLLKKIINNNEKISVVKKNGFITIISLEKNLESYEGIYVKLVSFDSKLKINKKNLNCENINKNFTEDKTIYKEYEYTKLNNEIKNNLKSINDYIVYINENNYNYIFLCELRYDEEILNNINFNKKVNFLATKIQQNFIRKYKKEYKYEKIE